MTTVADPSSGQFQPIASKTTEKTHRWFYLVISTIVMVMISPYQYAFTIFEGPVAKANSWPLSSVAMTFTIFIVISSLFTIPSGLWSDRWQPRWFTTVAGFAVGIGWVGAAFAQSAVELDITYGFGALGCGYIYANTVTNAVKWFPEPRLKGRTVGIANMGFAIGAAFFIPPLQNVINSGVQGYRTAFLVTGIIMLVVIVGLAQFLRFPKPGWRPAGWDPTKNAGAKKARTTSKDFALKEVFKSWQYWWVITCQLCILIPGLLLTAQVTMLARSNIALGGAAIGVLAATLSPIPNGIMRWVGGQLSDYFGREQVMVVMFLISAVATWALTAVTIGWLFIVVVLVAAGTWSTLFTLFPALVSDFYGSKHAGILYACVYGPAKAIAGVFAGVLGALLFAISGSWNFPFYIAAALAALSGIAILVLHLLPSPSESYTRHAALSNE
ncbi:MAG TPA: OFA family MFS transporter [Pseudonocardiaceae bacterium]